MTTTPDAPQYYPNLATSVMNGVAEGLGALSTRTIMDAMDTGATGASLFEFVDEDEKYRLGSIVDVQPVQPDAVGLDTDIAPSALYSVAVADPYVKNYGPETVADVMTTELAINDFARTRREMGLWQRKPVKAYDAEHPEAVKKEWGDPISTHTFFDEMLDSEAVRVWRSETIPSALALAYLSDPYSRRTIHSKDLNKDIPIDEEARKWWTLCTDAVAIRSRGTVMAEVVNGYVERYTGNGGDPDNLRWMSIACGTALPTLKAAVNSGTAPKITLIDYDLEAMQATSELAEEIGFEGEITTKAMNIFDTERMARLKEKLAADGELPQLVDMMGIFEYTGDNLGIDPVPFLRSGYNLVAPGGTLILGQMRKDRPVEDFTMGVVAWPFVEQRSPKELMQMVTAAGIPQESVRIYMPTDGVYMVVAIDKPAAAGVETETSVETAVA